MNLAPTDLLPDIPRIFTALAEFLTCFITLFFTSEHEKGMKAAVLSVIFLAVQVIFLILTDDVDGVLWIVCMAIAVLGMLLYLWVIHDCSGYTAVYYCAEAFILAEFMASLHWMLFCYYSSERGQDTLFLRVSSMILIYGIILALILWLNHSVLAERTRLMEVNAKEMAAAVIIGVVVFAFSNISFVMMNTPFSGSYSYAIYQLRTFIDLGGAAILYAYHIQIQNMHMTADMVKLEAILQTQVQQYRQSKEVTDNINYKYHDLKQYITLMRGSETNGDFNHVLDKIEDEIHDYEVQNKTGNQVLDTILSAKSITCTNQNILLTTVIQGELLEFLDVIDICSIFGNALDNAIEYEETVTEPEKRMINLTVVGKQAFVLIRCENYYAGSEGMTLEDKLPHTTKSDKSLHGYGLRSIQHAVHKYGGEMDIEVKDHWFRMKILIPLTEKDDNIVKKDHEA